MHIRANLKKIKIKGPLFHCQKCDQKNCDVAEITKSPQNPS